MDQELKQRLIGAVVITALAAIFVPMLFDDPVQDTGKNINALKLPEIPAKVQDVEIVPLPEKTTDVVPSELSPPTEKSLKPLETQRDAPVQELDVEARKPKLHLSSRDKTNFAETKSAHPVEADLNDAAAEDFAPPKVVKPQTLPSTKLPAQSVVQTVTPTAPVAPVAKSQKAPTKPTELASVETPAVTKSAATNPAGNRWYLNAGSFQQKNNAVNLLESLKQQGFAATLKEVSNEKGIVYKVRVGPMLDKAQVQQVKNKLTQINVNTFVSPDE